MTTPPQFRCTHNCNQGRACTCDPEHRLPFAEKCLFFVVGLLCGAMSATSGALLWWTQP